MADFTRAHLDHDRHRYEAPPDSWFEEDTTMKYCHWREDENGAWDTGCGEKWEFTNGTPQENRFLFCPFCGDTIEEHAAKEED